MKTPAPTKGRMNGYWIAALILVCAVLLAFSQTLVIASYVFAPGELRYTCDDFTTYTQALDAYAKGAIYLDGNGDTIPCNALFDKAKKP